MQDIAPSLPADDAVLLDALLDATVDAIVVADARGRILRVNRAAAMLFRHPVEAMVGAELELLMEEDMAARHGGFMDHHLATGERRIIGIGRDLTGRRGDGSTFPLHLSVGRAEAHGEPIFVGILHDQTKRRAAEAALTRAQRMDAVGQMTGGIAHDFNNLLTIITGNLELLEMAGPGSARGRTHRGRPFGRRDGGGPHLAAAPLLTEGRAEARAARPRRRHRGRAQAPAAHPERAGARRADAERRPLARHARPDAASDRDHQPRSQRAGRDAGGRATQGPDRESRHRTTTTWPRTWASIRGDTCACR